MSLFIFFSSLAVIAYTYIGYPLILALLTAMMSKPVKKAEIYPYVSILLSAYNEEKNIELRINNLLELDYPREKMDIIVGSDGSTDETYKIIKRLSEEKMIRYAVSFQRIGKPRMLNELAKDAKGEIFVFADARQSFDRDAVKELMKCFADEEVGCATGELVIEDKEAGSGRGLGLYWDYEKSLRKMESAIGSMLGATGAIYAIRRDLFKYLPENLLLDDVYTPMNAIMMGKRVVFEPAAHAYDVVSETTQKEFARKVRTLAGNFQLFSIFSEAFNPFKSTIAFQLFSHKFLRLLAPYFLFALFISNILLMAQAPVFILALFLQIILYVMALLGYLLERSGAKISGFLRILYIPFEFCALNTAAVAALCVYLRGGMDVKWEK